MQAAKNILIVDDDIGIRNALKRRFQLVKNINCFETSDGSGAFYYLLEKNIDIMILDIKMPGVTGLELLKMLNNDFQNLKIIILSAYTTFNNISEIKTVNRKNIKVLSKPCDSSTLLNTINTLLTS